MRDEKTAADKFKEIKENISSISQKISDFEKERATLEGQKNNILSSCGVNSIEELKEIVQTKTKEFEEETEEFYSLFTKIKEALDKIEESKSELEGS